MKRKRSVECWLYRDRGAGMELLLLQVPTSKSRRAYWQPATGGLEEGETPLLACCREVLEETGLRLNPKSCLLLAEDLPVPIAEPDKRLERSVFVAPAPGAAVQLSPEHVQARWVLLPDVLEWLHLDRTRHTFPLVRDHLLRRPVLAR